jgi:DnaJ homolog subfamily C member 9
MTETLFASAFGASACLYADVLQCDRSATALEIRRAYYRRALLFHPDKQRGDVDTAEATLCFQAVSAAYEILMDSGRRALYDATGQFYSCSHRNGSDDWTEFFKSVFHEVVTVHHEDAMYRGSDREASDVIRFYQLCKGDLDKVLSCVVSGKKQDKTRWARDIIEPAIRRGHVERYDAFDRTSGMKDDDSLVDTEDEEDAKKRKRIRKRIRADDDQDRLIDTDKEEVSSKKARTKKISKAASMSKKDKMDYRVARKQKEKKEKQVEFAKIVKEKNWDGAGMGKHSRPGTFSYCLISSLASKYSAGDDVTRAQKLGKKKKHR